MNLSVLRRTAAEIAAAAVHELYPNVVLWGGGETSVGFCYEFYFPHSIHPDTTPQIEERMRQITREKRAIRTLEMVPVSARELLKSQGHLARTEDLEDEGLVEVIQIGSFHDLSYGPHLKNTAELAAFKISIEPLPENGMRLVGWTHTSKDELKKYLKQLNAYETHNNSYLGEKKGLWTGSLWLPQGLKLRRTLIDFLKGQLFADAMEVAGPLEADRTTLHLSLKKPKVAEVWTALNDDFDPEFGLLQPEQETRLQITFSEKPEQELISLLHSIAKTLTILGFSYSTLFVGRERTLQRLGQEEWGVKVEMREGKALQIDFLIEDGLSREWSVFQLKSISTSGFIVTASVERVIALLLEKNLGHMVRI